MDLRSPSERERDRLAILRGDRRKLTWIAPLVVKASRWLWVIWLIGFAGTAYVGAEVVILFAVGFVPVLLFWFLGKFLRRAAEYADQNWK
jgi:fatty acid desaturase